jgi:hypothetical protein
MPDAQVGELELPPVVTCDEDVMPALQARKTSRLYFYLGFALLPWFWATNVWLFWPDFRRDGGDAVVAKCECQHAADAAKRKALHLPCMIPWAA